MGEGKLGRGGSGEQLRMASQLLSGFPMLRFQ